MCAFRRSPPPLLCVCCISGYLAMQVRAKQRRAAQREEALVRFHATADSMTREAFRTQGSKRILASVPMDLFTTDAVSCRCLALAFVISIRKL